MRGYYGEGFWLRTVHQVQACLVSGQIQLIYEANPSPTADAFIYTSFKTPCALSFFLLASFAFFWE